MKWKDSVKIEWYMMAGIVCTFIFIFTFMNRSPLSLLWLLLCMGFLYYTIDNSARVKEYQESVAKPVGIKSTAKKRNIRIPSARYKGTHCLARRIR